VIFRGIQIVVWKDRIEIRYQLGLSDNMTHEELVRLGADRETIPVDAGDALRLYRDLINPELPGGILVVIDDRPRVLTPRRSNIVRQRHTQLELVYRIEYVVSERPVRFVLTDENFKNVPGYHLAAIKARGAAAVLESNTFEVLSRLARDPQTEEDVAILNRPIRRVEAVISALPSSDPPRAATVKEDVSVHSGSTTTALSDSPDNDPLPDEPGPSPASGHTAPVKSPTLQFPVTAVLGALLIAAAVVWTVINLRKAQRS
jgi:hypothetical protein